MAQTKKGPARPCRIFLCYRGNTAETANHFRSVMEHDRENSYGNIWYSSRQISGRLIRDLPAIMGEAEWVIFFIGKTFTGGFIDENEETNKHCVTAQELIAIETERQKRQREGREELKMLTINIDDAKLDRTCELDLKHLFSNAKILEDDSVGTYTELLPNVYNSSRDDLLDFVEEHIAPICALPAAPPVEVKPITEPGLKKESKQEPPAEHKKTEVTPAPTIQTENVVDRWVETGKAAVEQFFSGTKADPPVVHDPVNTAPKNDKLEVLGNGSVLFGSYPQTAEGERRPIEWLVLKREKDRALLISRYALDCKPYHVERKPISWVESSLRQWLNEDFLLNAFTADDQRLISISAVSVEHDPSSQDELTTATMDKVFLLSIIEAKMLFFSDMDRRCIATVYAKWKGATDLFYRKDRSFTCEWWLRSTRCDTNKAFVVFFDGNFKKLTDVNATYAGVRPAIWVKLPELAE